MVRSHRYLITVSIILLVVIVSSIVVFQYEAYLFMSFFILLSLMYPFFARFELKTIETREVVLLAVLAAIAAVSRVPFAGLPSVQPTSFVIIMTGLVFGAESGFIVGAIAALVSNIFLGQGPWTPWQMYAWGMMGMSAGLLRNQVWMATLWGKTIFGFIWGFVFGWFMNIWIIVSNISGFSWAFVIGVYVTSVSHDLAHALSNVFFILVFSSSWLRMMERFKRKYGLLDSELKIKNTHP